MGEIIHKDIYSNRIKEKGEIDPYVYKIKGGFMVNSFMIFLTKFEDKELMKQSIEDFCETKGLFTTDNIRDHMLLGLDYYDNYIAGDLEVILSKYDTIDILDFLEICINNIKNELNDCTKKSNEFPFQGEQMEIAYITSIKNDFIDYLNEVFEHNNLGYRVVNDIIVTKESDFLHVEAISKPLTLLVNEDFSGPLNEFETAIDKYTHKDYENTVIEACKAFESTMKAVLDKLGVEYDHDKPPANALINLLKDNGIFDSFQDDNINKLTNVLQGLPTIRNRMAGHGDGIDTKEVERSYASFALNLAGSYIVFILDRYYENDL